MPSILTAVVQTVVCEALALIMKKYLLLLLMSYFATTSNLKFKPLGATVTSITAMKFVAKTVYYFLTSTGYDSLLAFDLDKQEFVWGFHLQKQLGEWTGFAFDPRGEFGPRAINEQHINMVHVDSTGIYLSGLRTRALLHIDNKNKVTEVCSLPAGTHNARPFKDGIIFNDTASDCLRVVPRQGQGQAYKIRSYDPAEIQFAGIDDSKIARQAFGRGLCVIDERFVAGGSSPSTVTLYDLESRQVAASVNMTMDIRNAIHGLALWPY